MNHTGPILVTCCGRASHSDVIPALCGDPLTAERQAMVRRSLAGAWTAILRRRCRQVMCWIPDLAMRLRRTRSGMTAERVERAERAEGRA